MIDGGIVILWVTVYLFIFSYLTSKHADHSVMETIINSHHHESNGNQPQPTNRERNRGDQSMMRKEFAEWENRYFRTPASSLFVGGMGVGALAILMAMVVMEEGWGVATDIAQVYICI